MKQSIKRGSFLLFKGPLTFKILAGKVEAVGSIINKNSEKQIIPLGKGIPIEALTDSILDIQIEKQENIEFLKENTISVKWQQLINNILKKKQKKLIVLGEVDTGKSFFITYIANKLIQAKKSVSIIDSDLGQSDVGPPGTIGYTVLKKPIMFLGRAKIDGIEFVGSHSPGLHMIPTIIQFNKIIQKCKTLSDIILVNTSGWVMGDGGRLLSKAKIDILKPDVIVLMQRNDECEHLVKNIFPKEKIIRITASKKASHTSKGDREQLRNLSSQNYFIKSKLISLPLHEIETDKCFFKTGTRLNNIQKTIKQKVLFAEKYSSFEGILIVTKKPLSNSEMSILKKNGLFSIRNLSPDFADGALVGLRDKKNNLLNLGIIKNINFIKKKINIVTPLKQSSTQIKIVQFGAIKYKSDGTENGFFEPGSF